MLVTAIAEGALRGYRFLAEVRVVDGAPVRGPEPAIEAVSQSPGGDRPVLSGDSAAHKRRIRPLAWKISFSVIVLLVVILTAWTFRSRNRASPVIRSLAVLPLESLSGDTSQDYFADGMTDELITDLGQISALRVISRTSVMSYKQARKPLPQIARELNVDAVVEGTVLRSGNQVRITAQLIQASDDKHLWAQSYEGDLRDTLALQSQVARAIAEQIRISVNPQEQAALKSVKVVNPQAYESFLKGRYFWNKRTADGLKVAVAYFNQAIEEDPAYAQAYSGLADTYALLGDWQYAVMTPKEALPKAKAAAIKALKMDNALGEAHNSLAFCLDGFDWDFESAGREFQRAIDLNPGYATAHHWYAWHLSLVGRRAAESDPDFRRQPDIHCQSCSRVRRDRQKERRDGTPERSEKALETWLFACLGDCRGLYGSGRSGSSDDLARNWLRRTIQPRSAVAAGIRSSPLRPAVPRPLAPHWSSSIRKQTC
jgi:TolB-like protein